MTHDATNIPAELRISFDAAPSVETRAALGHEINEYHGRTVPQDARRFALPLYDEKNRLVAGLRGHATDDPIIRPCRYEAACQHSPRMRFVIEINALP